MDTFFLASLVSFYFCLYGFGVGVGGIVKTKLPVGVTPVMGLTALLVVGGVLNILGLAYPGSLLGVTLIGWILGLWHLSRMLRRTLEQTSNDWPQVLTIVFKESLHYWPVIIFGLVAYVFYANPSAFNLHDDFEKYLKYPIRMLQQGKLSASKFDALGTEALGGMSFLQSFAYTVRPIAYLNAIDAVLGLTLCMATVAALLKALGRHWGWSVLFSAMIAFIDPFYVNTSAIYMGAAVLMLVFIIPFFCDSIDDCFDWRHSILFGLSYAGLLSLKTSLALFIPVHYAFFFGVSILGSRKRLPFLGWGLRIPFLSLVFAAPWLGSHRDKLVAVMSAPEKEFMFSSELPAAPILPGWKPFSTEILFYGFTVTNIHFSFFVITLLTVSCIAAYYASKPSSKKWMLLLAAFSLAIFYILGMWILAPIMSGHNAGLRYVGPVLIAGCAVFALSVGSWEHGDLKNARARIVRWVSILAGCGVLVMFAPSVLARYEQALRLGHSLSIPTLARREYVRYCEFLMGLRGRTWVQGAQATIPQGGTVLAWTMASFQLDYGRNNIIDVDPAGLISPGLDFPFASELRTGVEYLKEEGISYVIWQYAGLAVRSKKAIQYALKNDFPRRRIIALRQQQFVSFLSKVSTTESYADVIYDDDQIRVLHIK